MGKAVLKHRKLIVFFLLIIVVFALDRIFGWSSTLSDSGTTARLSAMLAENEGKTALIYVILTIAGSALLALPGVTFAIIAGLLFGPWKGTLLCVLAATAGAMLAFLLGRYFLRDSIRPYAMKNRLLKHWLFDESGHHAVLVLMVTRLVPLFPFNLQNYAYGITDIRFSTYSFFSFVFMLPGTAVYTIGTAGVADADNRVRYLTIAVALFAAVMLTAFLLKKKYGMQTREEAPAETEAKTSGTDMLQPEAVWTAKRVEEMCVHCHICKAHCAFLTKYDLDIGDTKALSPLAYHCFLCGKCTAVCPKGIDGRAFLLGCRCDETEANGGRLRQKGYGLLLAEKKKYRFRNVKHATGKTVLFPGCNFPSFFPETLEKLRKLLGERDIGVWYDCCGKPVAELCLRAAAADSLTRMEETLRERGIKELVTMCPNCYDYLTPRLSVPVVDIYTKLKELGIGRQDIPAGEVFLPCPDREKRELLARVQDFVSGTLTPREDAQCCGLGGCAAAKEPALAARMAKEAGHAKTAEHGGADASVPLYTYCATCAGSLGRNGAEGVRHVLSLILETDEAPDVKHSLRNRVKTRFV